MTGMAKYIELDLFLKNVRRNAPYIYHMVAPIALITPAADVAPVRHGRWIDGDPYCPICRKDKFRGLDADVWADWKPDYCPNCGAKMDLEDSE